MDTQQLIEMTKDQLKRATDMFQQHAGSLHLASCNDDSTMVKVWLDQLANDLSIVASIAGSLDGLKKSTGENNG